MHDNSGTLVGGDDVDAFARDGVVCIRGLLDAAWIERKKMIRLLHDPGLAPGDLLDCGLFPVVWPRPEHATNRGS